MVSMLFLIFLFSHGLIGKNLKVNQKKAKVCKAWERAHECRSKVIFVVLCYKNTRLRGQSLTIPATNGR